MGGGTERKEFARELEARTRRFAVMIITLSAGLPKTTEAMVIRNQLTKAGTSVGANYREANRARSRADFKNKIRICESELSEAQYWLEVVIEAGWAHRQDIASESDECRQLLALFSSIAKNCA
jgi:four helix bundle protein